MSATTPDQLVVFGDHEQKVIAQAMRCLNAEPGSLGSLSGDAHFGYSAPIGLSWALREHVSPAAVGYDIGCGNLAVQTSLRAADIAGHVPGIMDRIFSTVSFGMGRRDGGAGDHDVIDLVRDSPSPMQRALVDTAAAQLGTVGAGNHYVDVFEDEDGFVWVGVHFGSRGLGHKTATHYLNLAAVEAGRNGFKEGGGEMEAPPDLLPLGSEAGAEYLEAMKVAGAYAYAGREVVVGQVLGILGLSWADVTASIHNHHNYAWSEVHYGEHFLVIRKGATPAFPQQKGFVGATMGEPAVILEGVDGPRSADALYSTVHGAGRAMSRTAAAGKSRKRWTCNNRDCDWVQQPRTHVDQPKGTRPSEWACPSCGHVGLAKRMIRETEGAIDWSAVESDLAAKGIELRGANAEEAPGAYKRLDEVLAHHAGTVRTLHVLTPLGVAMAPGDTRDEYKD